MATLRGVGHQLGFQLPKATLGYLLRRGLQWYRMYCSVCSEEELTSQMFVLLVWLVFWMYCLGIAVGV